MRITDRTTLIVTVMLLTALTVIFFSPAAAADTATGYPDCGTVWMDTCVPFERNNETAYNQEIETSLEKIAENMTGMANFGELSWSDAFLSAHTLMKERYAFTEWRDVDWDELYRAYAPAVADAERGGDQAAYFRALMEYVYAIPDGHVDLLLISGNFGAKYADIGGSYGFAVSGLDSGKVIVSYVEEGSEADKAGIRFGDEVTAWNGMEIDDAVNATPYIWAVKKPSTAEGILLHRQRLLTRAPVGTKATVTLTGADGSNPRTVELAAFDDGYETVSKTSYFLGKEVNDYGAERTWLDIRPQISNDTVTSRTLPGGYAYIAIFEESYGVYQPFKEAMLSAIANKSPGIVLDLRFNSGGDDNLASCFAGWFVDQPAFYEYATSYDPGTGRFTVVSEAWISPRDGGYDGPVAVLVSPDTISSGEGLPMIFSRTGRGEIISFYGTNGAFGMNNVQAVLPHDIYLFFPDGASLDHEGVIQVDSNASLTGGIPPGIRVPVNEDTVARSMAGEDVQLTYALQWLDEQQAASRQSSPGPAPVIIVLVFILLTALRKQ